MEDRDRDRDRDRLNGIYKPLHEAGKILLRTIKDLGYEAKLSYYNMHYVKVDGEYQIEYFPLPEVGIAGVGFYGDFGISLDGSIWFELTVSKERALILDYKKLSQVAPIEVYGAQDYLADIYNERLDIESMKQAIDNINEKEIHICFYLKDSEAGTVKSLTELLNKQLSIDENGRLKG